MNNPFQTDLSKIKTHRSQMLTVLCILTFIGSGLNFISSFAISVFFDTFTAILSSNAIPDIYSEIMSQAVVLMEKGGPVYYALSAVLYVGSIVGAALMLNLKKTGFHIYTISQILLLLIPIPFRIMQGFPFFAVLLTGIFVLLYYFELRKIPAITVKEEDFDE